MTSLRTLDQKDVVSKDADPLVVRSPRVIAGGDWAAAYASAVEGREPVFVPVSPYCDDRGWSYMNLLHGVLTPEGQVNFSVQYPGVVKAWHRHQRQTDFWMCLTGHLRVGVASADRTTAWSLVIGEKRPGVMIIPPTLWHGAATVGHTPAGLLYFVTRAFDRDQPDEERMPFDAIDGFPWTVENR